MSGPVTVRDVLDVLLPRHARLLAGESGLSRGVTWASTMRPRLPAFEGFQGGEVALLSLAILRALRGQLVSFTLPEVIDQLADIGVSAIVVAGLDESAAPAERLDLARVQANRHRLPLLSLPPTVSLPAVEREIIAHVVAQRERPTSATLPPDLYAQRLRASLRAEALDALLTGTYAGEAQMRSRAAQLGFDLLQPHAVLWVDIGAEHPSDAPVDGEASANEDALPAATHLAGELEVALGAWVRVRGAEVVALLPVAPRAGREDVAERVVALLTRALDDAWSAGLGDAATAPAQVRRSATEARDASRLGRMVLGHGRLARPGDLGVYQLLLLLRDSGELAPFVERTLGPLHADARAGEALIETLDAFFACNGNLSEAARRLHLHRNSLLYRLNRAHELLGYDLDDPERRLTLQLAIKGRRVLDL